MMKAVPRKTGFTPEVPAIVLFSVRAALPAGLGAGRLNRARPLPQDRAGRDLPRTPEVPSVLADQAGLDLPPGRE